MKEICVGDFLKKYNTLISTTQFCRYIKDNNIQYIRKDGTKKIYDEDVLIKLFKLENYNSDFVRSTIIVNKYGVSYSTLDRYANANKNDISCFLFIMRKLYINQNVFVKKYLPSITKTQNMRIKQSTSTMNSLFDNKMGSDYKRLEDIKDKSKKIKVLHIPCGHIVEMTPDNSIYKGTGCPHCFKTKKYNIAQ